MGIYLPGTGTLGCVVWPGSGILHSWGIPPDFYPPHVNVGQTIPLPLHAPLSLCTSAPIPTSLPLLPVWMNVATLNPWLSDFHTALFLMVLGVICFEVWL